MAAELAEVVFYDMHSAAHDEVDVRQAQEADYGHHLRVFTISVPRPRRQIDRRTVYEK